MQKTDFDTLGKNDQEGIISKYGVHLTAYDDGNFNCDLYRLYNFFVILCCDCKHAMKSKIKTFGTMRELHSIEIKALDHAE